MKKYFLLLLIPLLPMMMYADGVEIDGIYYELITKIGEAKVIKKPTYLNDYKGNVVIPESVSYNGKQYNVSSIESYAFASSYVTSIVIPQSVTNIGECAFRECQGLTTVNIPNGVKSIGREAFLHCSITSITIPRNVESIGQFPFVFCDYLQSIKVESDNKYYDSRENCNAIIEKSSNTLISGCMNTIIPNSIKKIGILAFQGCSGLKSITIPSSVKIIEDNAFDECVLESITLSEGLNTIGKCVFRGSKITTIVIPNSVTSIGDAAFGNCDNLTTINIGENVKKIGSCTFSNCKEITDVYCYAKSVPANVGLSVNSAVYGKSLSDAFDGSLINYATLHVPSSSLNLYMSKQPWKNFGNIVAIEQEDNLTEVKAMPIMIRINDGVLNISGALKGTPISVYGMEGRQLTTSTAENGITKVPLITTDSIVTVKIGEKAMKIKLK